MVALVYASPGFADDYKIGVVNAPKVLEMAPQADAARKKLEKEARLAARS